MSRNTSKFLAVAILSTLAAVASVSAQAGDVYDPPAVAQFHSVRSRADVKAEAVVAARQWHGGEAAVEAVVPVAAAPSTDRATVRAETVQAIRLGKVSHGEVGVM